MSAEARPISAEAFALAIQELPIGSLYAKASELQNSLHHLRRSNEQLKPFADDGDEDCATAIRENDQVMERFEQRVQLLKEEVEARGNAWTHGGAAPRAQEAEALANGTAVNGASVNGDTETTEANSTERPAQTQPPPPTTQRSAMLSDDELRRLLNERMGLPDDEEEGLHL